MNIYTIIIEDFDAKIGKQLEQNENNIDKYCSYGNKNERRGTMEANGLFAMNTFFDKKKNKRNESGHNLDRTIQNEID